MRKLVLLALLCACAHGPSRTETAGRPGAPAPPRLLNLPPAITHKEARELMAMGEWDAALQRLEDYLLQEPGSAAGLFDAGWVSEKRGDKKAAADFYQRALKSDAGHPGAALNAARLLRGQDNLLEAEKVLQAALQKRSGDPQLLNGLASLLRAEKKLDRAEEAVRKVLLRHPRDADAYRNLAAIEADRGRVRLAETALNNARKLDDKDAGILNSLGLLAMRRDDVAAARGYFEEAAKLDPNLPAAWANLGALALGYRDYAAAEQAYAKAVQLDGSRWETRLAHGWALEGLKRPKDARAEYETVLALRPAQGDALYGKALALKVEGDLTAALAAFKEYAALPKAARAKEAQSQMAAIDLRLKNPPAAPKPAAASARRGVPDAANLDLSKLPQGTDTGPSTEKLPTEEGMGPGAPTMEEPGKTPDRAPEKVPAAGKDGGVQKSIPAGEIKAASR